MAEAGCGNLQEAPLAIQGVGSKDAEHLQGRPSALKNQPIQSAIITLFGNQKFMQSPWYHSDSAAT